MRQRHRTSPGTPQRPKSPPSPVFTAPIPTPRAHGRGSPRLHLKSQSVQEYGLKDAARWSSRPVVERRLREGTDAHFTLASTKELRDKYHLGSSQLRRSEREQEWFHIARGWWANRTLDDIETLCATACILPEDVVISGETACLMYGIDVRPPSRADDAFAICVVRPPGHRAICKPGIRCRVMDIRPDEWVTTDFGVKVATPLRTACNMAMTHPIDRAVAVLEGFLRAELVTYQELIDAVAPLRGRRGVRTLRLALKLVDQNSESPGETTTRLRLLAAGLPSPESQITVRRLCRGSAGEDQSSACRVAEEKETVMQAYEASKQEKGQEFRIDLGWRLPDHGGIGVEYFGFEYHAASLETTEKERARLMELQQLGWVVLVVRSKDLQGDITTFEALAAQLLGETAYCSFRERWNWSRFDRYRNAWNRVA